MIKYIYNGNIINTDTIENRIQFKINDIIVINDVYYVIKDAINIMNNAEIIIDIFSGGF